MFPHHVFPDSATVNSDGHLTIGGCDAVNLANKYGTPLYVFDDDTLRGRCRTFSTEFKTRYANCSVVYASKAYINPALAKIIEEEGLGLDVVSGGELAVAQSVEFPKEQVYFHGNNKSPDELQQAIDWGIGRIVIDSFSELSILDDLAGQSHITQSVMLRVSPSVDPHTHHKTTTGILDSKFGFAIDTGDAAKAVRLATTASNLDLTGLHFHLGSPIFELEPYSTAMEVVLAFANNMKSEGLNLRDLSPGGGFAISYTRNQEPPPIAQYAEAIVRSLEEGCARFEIDLPHLIIEPGRAISGPAGVALYSVGTVKDIPGVRRYVSVDGGMGDNIRPALYEAVYEAMLANRMNEEATELVTIAGKYCESGDILVRDAMLPPITNSNNDLVVIPASGAYCPSMASNYNLNPKPPVVLVKDGVDRLIRRRESYKDQMLLDI